MPTGKIGLGRQSLWEWGLVVTTFLPRLVGVRSMEGTSLKWGGAALVKNSKKANCTGENCMNDWVVTLE